MRSRPGKVRLRSSPEQLLRAGVLLDESSASGQMDLPAIFGNRRPVEIEIGPGKGAFLLRRAAERPELNLLGLEWVRSYACYAADRALRAGLGNVRLLCADAEAVFRTCLPGTSVWRVHIHFPDPWPKRKHRRRRLIKPPFAMNLRRVLRLGGQVGVITDHAGYFHQICRVLSGEVGLAEVPFAGTPGPGRVELGTNFERKYTARGSRFYTFAAVRDL
jgi:tRNA (guanine-N7-)-methyltransferase